MRALRGVAAGVLTLVVLQALSTGRGPAQGGKLIGWAATGMRHLMAADRPGVPRVGPKPAPPAKNSGRKDNEISGGGGALPRNPTLQA